MKESYSEKDSKLIVREPIRQCLQNGTLNTRKTRNTILMTELEVFDKQFKLKTSDSNVERRFDDSMSSFSNSAYKVTQL